MFMYYLHTRFHIPSASGSNQQLNRSFSVDSMVFLYILQNDYCHTLFQDCKLRGFSVASISDFCILTMLVQIMGNWEVQHWSGMLCYNVYTKFHKVWMTCLENELGGGRHRSLLFFGTPCIM